ncbi:SGNH/GDSL hydrolase family protein [Actinacidiphila bryophytorum]|uniref:SGNH/GDSL hydrolase family protein n=1 Tax=Actinacidiphila bryophytorum TaxID=1436133 RepID=UPI002176E28E|nr:SGNH/GDSL hydrolase family protein [Actinacidiphila bryophytorum]UWE08608.1 SGNH/GDSL hydrolase family protein [Actinacidiphila bryophytorum]
MRPLLRPGLALAVGAVLLGGCLSGCSSGGSPDGERAPTAGSPTAHTSHSPRQAAPAAPAAPARPWNVHPASVAALGDSITRGFDACKPLLDCPEVSWATGTRTGVGSIAHRLTATGPATRSWNLAGTGARVADLQGQAEEAATHRPAMVTVLIGANDACRSSLGAMTPVADFRSDFAATMAYLHKTLPSTQILVASIPDLQRLWSVGRSNVLGKQVWKLGLCPTMLDDPDSQSAAAVNRRTAVRDRVVAYNTALSQVCGQYARCRYDGGAVFGYRFGSDELSSWDWFHPNEKGQEQLAGLLAAVAFRPQQ